MSVVFVVVPVVVAGWPVLCGAIAGAAGALGCATLRADNNVVELGQEAMENTIELPLEGSQVVVEAMQRESEFVIRKDDILATFSRGAETADCFLISA